MSNDIGMSSFRIEYCPKCGKTVDCVPAISRIDGSWICSDCGTREALDSIGVCPDEQERIIETIHRSCGTQMNENRA